MPDRSVGGVAAQALDAQQGRTQRPPHVPLALPQAHQVELRPRKAVCGLLEVPADTLAVKSTADGWDLTVPEDDAELLAELRRHGVRPGQRLHVVAAQSEPAIVSEEAPREPRKNRRLSLAGSIQAEPDLSEKADEYLKGFGRG